MNEKSKKIVMISIIFVLLVLTISIGILIGGLLRGVNIVGIDNTILIVTSIFSGCMGFIGSLVGVLGAFYIFRLEVKKDENKKLDEKSEQMEHKKKMLYTLLEFSYLQTRISSEFAKQIYKDSYTKIPCKDNSIVQKYKLSGEIMDDFKKMLMVKPCNDTENFDAFIGWINGELSEQMKESNICKRVIYIENWYDYLDCVPNLDDINAIVFWITMLKSSDTTIDAIQFISNRENIDRIIRKYYQRAIDEGVRGKIKMNYIPL